MKPLTIFLDFDGTMVEHIYPAMGRVVPHAVRVVRRLQDAGHMVILNTYRADIKDDSLDQAVNWLNSTWRVGKVDLLPLKAITASKINPAPFILNDELQIHHDRTVGGVIYLDDIATGTPLIPAVMSTGRMVNWLEVEQILEANHIFEPTESHKLSKTLNDE